MKILHYGLGFSPYRTGGMTRYLMDLMLGQKTRGDTVLLLWPGSIQKYVKNVYIRHDGKVNGVESYEVCNPMPVPLLGGVKEPGRFQNTEENKRTKDIFLRFFQQIRPDVFHIHTWMGGYQEMMWAAKECGIPIVFTAHDFYGICPQVNFYGNGHFCERIEGGCSICNRNAISYSRIFILQSSIYQKVKNKKFMINIRNFYKWWKRKTEKKKFDKDRSEEAYVRLREYYTAMIEQVDYFHFASKLTRDIYRSYVNIEKSNIIPISHVGAYHHPNIIKKQENSKLQIGYMEPVEEYKGFRKMIDILDLLDQEKFSLHVFQKTDEKRSYMIQHEPYTEENQKETFQGMDLILVPSVCYETYSFVVLEALCYEIPVLMSNTVGAKDLVNDSRLFVYKENLQEKLAAILRDRSILEKMKKYMKEEVKIPGYGAHVEKMDAFYKRAIRLEQVSGNYKKSEKIVDYRKQSRSYL